MQIHRADISLGLAPDVTLNRESFLDAYESRFPAVK